MRRPPRAATKHKALRRTAYASGDYAAQRRLEEHTNALAATECRIVAWLVCRALGDAWRFEPDEEHRHHRLVHRATCAVLTFKRDWNNGDRYSISPENLYRSDSMPRSITVSGDRSPGSIARDIERRLIDVGLFDQNAQVLSGGHDRRQKEVRDRLQCLAVARAYGGQLMEERRWKSSSYPAATTEHFGELADEYGRRRVTEISATMGYNGIELEVHTNSVELACKVAKLVKHYYEGNQAYERSKAIPD